MDASRRWQPVKEPLWWLALLLALLGGMWSDYGLADGLERFAVFVYWGSCTLVIMQLSASLLVRIPLSKPGVLVPGSIVIAYAVVQGTRLGVESVWKGALLGLYFGLILGVIAWFLSSRYAEGIRTMESSFYARIHRWFRSRSS
jgi:hypothetical protein